MLLSSSLLSRYNFILQCLLLNLSFEIQINFRKKNYSLWKIIFFLGLGIKDEGFRNAAIFATTLWKHLGYSEQACSELINQLKRFDQKLKPYDLSYDINVDHPQIWWGSIRHKSRYIQDLAL